MTTPLLPLKVEAFCITDSFGRLHPGQTEHAPFAQNNSPASLSQAEETGENKCFSYIFKNLTFQGKLFKPTKKLFQKFASNRILVGNNFFRSAAGNDPPTVLSTAGAEVENIIRGFNHIGIVLDHDHGGAFIHKLL